MYKLVENRSEKVKNYVLQLLKAFKNLLKKMIKWLLWKPIWVELVSSQISKIKSRKFHSMWYFRSKYDWRWMWIIE